MYITTGKTFALLKGPLRDCLFHSRRCPAVQQLHLSVAMGNYVNEASIPLPINVDSAETTRFSPQRSRDISSTVINAQAPISSIDITIDNSFHAVLSDSNICHDPHVQSYDCFGSISLNSAMQSNVPTPFGGLNKFSHLNMPGGQWSQEFKFTAQNMQCSHYSALRDSLRADWATYDQNATLKTNDQGFCNRRNYSTQSPMRNSSTNTSTGAKLSKSEQLKKAFKEYGAPIVAFHVGISLISLGGFYVLVSSGINLVPALEWIGISSSAILEKVATGSTFVVAYAVHKVFAPARISITLGSVPFLVRYIRSKKSQIPKPKNT
ncbi:uncharacterized protein LOC117137078 isoform X1 [Drosophila mauritiana]|uniref:Uncharacterized protein LOC117137078 isoform X1 n=1 Tax=Drosophila mauritiana TaxID=7226 RepID=A0A6P8JDM9_DROMA|nr:uncharacterized protein LOC117137078 isoform X1 [Drosophila mauritiana]